MELPDGRELAWLELGDVNDPAVFVFHGTPGSRLQISFDDGAINAARVRFIAVDRPGYGHSTFQRVRRLADWPSDIARLADHLHVEGFSVVGISGGGPHAAACARFLPVRVRGLALVSAVGPLAEPGSEAEMVIFNRLITRLARRSRHLVSPLFSLSGSLFRRWPEMAIRATSGQLPSSDIEIMSRPEVRSAYIDSYRRAPATTRRQLHKTSHSLRMTGGFASETSQPPSMSGMVMTTATSRFHMVASRRS